MRLALRIRFMPNLKTDESERLLRFLADPFWETQPSHDHDTFGMDCTWRLDIYCNRFLYLSKPSEEFMVAFVSSFFERVLSLDEKQS